MHQKIKFDKVREEVTEAKYKYDTKVDSIKGVRGLTKAEADDVLLYVDHFEQHGPHLVGLMRPRGKVKEVLDRYNITFEEA